MRKLYNEFFCIPKQGRIREKVMLTRVALIIVVMLTCLTAMSFSAYAYFSHSLTSGINVLQSAYFAVNASVFPEGSPDAPLSLTEEGGVQSVQLDPGTYVVELSKGSSSSKTGFCQITLGDTGYYTDQIGADVEKNQTDARVRFTLKLSVAAKLEIRSHWGTSSCYGYKSAAQASDFIRDNDLLDCTVSSQGAPSASEERIHVVQKNENLTQIAQLYQTTVDCLVAYNGIADPNLIRVGLAVKIPPRDWQEGSPSASSSAAASTAAASTAAASTAASTLVDGALA